jgi:hypothetical protein
MIPPFLADFLTFFLIHIRRRNVRFGAHERTFGDFSYLFAPIGNGRGSDKHVGNLPFKKHDLTSPSKHASVPVRLTLHMLCRQVSLSP